MASQSVRPPLRGDMSARQAMVLESAYGNNTPVKPAEEIGRLSSPLSLSLSLSLEIEIDEPLSAMRLDF